MIKQLQYKRWSLARKCGTVAYVIIGQNCYFTGTQKEYRMSTINAAESVVKAITEQENIPIRECRFFDLQTHKGYDKNPGIFEFDELVLEFSKRLMRGANGFIVSNWRPVECPAEVREIFREYIN